MKSTIYVVGMGPGNEMMLTLQAAEVLERSDAIIGYKVYLDLLPERYRTKELYSTPMKKEVDRCRLCLEEASKGKIVSLICSGDAGVYGMASLMIEVAKDCQDCEIVVVPGITAALSGAAVLGAPINHDFCLISLSDLLTPWEVIEKRLIAAAEGDFVIVLYNPSSKNRKDYLEKACNILLSIKDGATACGYVENIGREGTKSIICTLAELKNREVNMFTTVFIGSKTTKIIDGKLVTGRGYNVQ